MPDLPSEVLEKIATVIHSLGLKDPDMFPKPEPHCNCMHCQLARVIHKGMDEGGDKDDEEEFFHEDEEITDDDLRFREWDIEQVSENLYSVSNPFDSDEKYNVFLGNPVGCTCGQEDCEHIKAVLRS